MNRRGFLGSVIGIVAGRNFFARLATDTPQRVILPYRMAFREMNSGFLIQAPGVQEVRKIEGGFEFIAEVLEPKQTLHLGSVALFDKHGRFVQETKFTGTVPMGFGDKLNCTHKLMCNVEFQTADELMETFIRERNKQRV